jgi:RNA polymerase sigma-70 factor (ECF subfamily)
VIEDAAQGALFAALSAWVKRQVPDDPHAWLYRAARNRVLEVIRNERRRGEILGAVVDGGSGTDELSTPSFACEVRDELLRMLFVCCDDTLPRDSRLMLALKTLCGFSTGEIALRLFKSEASVHKRLVRARERLRDAAIDTQTPPLDALRSRLSSVHAVIYLLFNEGYLSTHAEHAIRAELCAEALRLAALLASHPVGETPTTFALLALMHFHAARLAARQDGTGGLLLLEEQDRSHWDAEHLRQGAVWLARAADGDTFTRFHAEAGIAAEYCLAPSFAETRWSEIADLHAMLEHIDPSPFHALNRAIAVAEARGPAAGLATLDGVIPPAWLDGHYMWDAVLADLHHRAGDELRASRHRERAIANAPSEVVRLALKRRLTAGLAP